MKLLNIKTLVKSELGTGLCFLAEIDNEASMVETISTVLSVGFFVNGERKLHPFVCRALVHRISLGNLCFDSLHAVCVK